MLSCFFFIGCVEIIIFELRKYVMSWNVCIGINFLLWMNDDLLLFGGEMLFEMVLKEGVEIGYVGFEFGNKFLKIGFELKVKFVEFGFVCVLGWYLGFFVEFVLGMIDVDVVVVEIECCCVYMMKL